MYIFHVWDVCENDSSLFRTFDTEEKAVKWIESQGEIQIKNGRFFKIRHKTFTIITYQITQAELY
tara:strand:- start:3584 stop:3778 length:195 start_codon:yes stop_codon:yes gene_type:complete